MRFLIIVFIIIALTGIELPAQEATIREQKVKIKTYMYSDPDPVPDMSRNYPYYLFDGFTNKAVEKDWNMIIMENKYIEVFITPEIGGKICLQTKPLQKQKRPGSIPATNRYPSTII